MNVFKTTTADIDRLARALARVPYLLLGLFILTIGLLLWHRIGMDRVLELSAASPFKARPYDDRTKGGGSVATVTRDDKQLVLTCDLNYQTEYPDCSIIFDLNVGERGIDLSHFESMSIDLDYSGPGPETVRTSLINFEPAISRLEERLSGKVNEVENLHVKPGEPIVVPLKAFSVARWWKDMRQPPLAHIDMRVDNVIRVELTTSVKIPAGRHVYKLRAIRFHGKWLTQSELLMGLVTLWILAAVAWPAMTSLILREQLDASRANVKLLRQVNEALQLESRELADQAYHDTLTGALNRQGLRAALMNTSTLLADPVSAIFMDIDHFKRINDTHGHDVGDMVLRQFAQAVKETIRSTDNLVRWGGEEFLIFCPATDVQSGVALAEKLRGVLRMQTWPNGLHVTSSFGVAQHLPNEEVGDLIKRADAQLYSAKTSGRDRVHADGLPPALDSMASQLRA